MRSKPNRGPCQIEDCPRDAWARGWCTMHYERWRSHGDPTTVVARWSASTEERFWAKVQNGPGCWTWTGARAGGTGYGQLYVDGRLELAHRFSYVLHVGLIPEGLVIDHLCRNRACVNPAHLEPVTNRENILRGSGVAARAALKTHCPQGHPYDAENTAIRPDGSRRCKECNRQRARAHRSTKEQATL